MSRREEILARVATIPAIPAAAVQLVEVLKDPDVDVEVVGRILGTDPGLAANCLRLANSAQFGTPRKIASIREAVVRIGLANVKLLVGAAVAPLARREVRGYDVPPNELWRHSLGVAVAAEELAAVLGKDAPASMFSAALLHDLGKIVLGTFLEVSAGPIRALAYDGEMSFDAAERQLLGTDHAEVGAHLLATWKLPAALVEVVRWHHDPDGAGAPNEVLDLVHVANHLARMAGLGAGADGLNYRLSNPAVVRLGLEPGMAETVLLRTTLRFSDLASLYEE